MSEEIKKNSTVIIDVDKILIENYNIKKGFKIKTKNPEIIKNEEDCCSIAEGRAMHDADIEKQFPFKVLDN